MREVFDRGIPMRTGKPHWDRSTVWTMLRNPDYRGQGGFGKTNNAKRYGGPTRTTRQRGERCGRQLTHTHQRAEKWTLIPVAPLITDETFALAQASLIENTRFSPRNTKELRLLQCVLVCRKSGRSSYRTTTSGRSQTAARGSRACLWRARPTRGSTWAPTVAARTLGGGRHQGHRQGRLCV